MQIQAEHLQGWIAAATWEQDLETGNWARIVDLAQTDLRDVTLTTDCMWKTVFLMPKENVDYRGIGLIKVLFSLVSGLGNMTEL